MPAITPELEALNMAMDATTPISRAASAAYEVEKALFVRLASRNYVIPPEALAELLLFMADVRVYLRRQLQAAQDENRRLDERERAAR